MSEIDDIFASKSKPKATLPLATLKRNKKDKKKKSKPGIASADIIEDSTPAKKRPLPETIVDSSTLSTATKRHRTDTFTVAPEKYPKTKKDSKEEEQFKDSRGIGPRRKTEEGWNIYKADELGISAEGGDTPLCPFDCQCCF